MSSTVETFTPRGSDRRKRIVLTAMGSLGDLHPSIAIGLGLQARGHDVVIATGECYRRKVEALGLGFRGVRPHTNFVADPEVMRRMMDYRWGTVRALREVALPIVRESYEDTLVASEGADLLVSHPITFATRLVAEKRGIPWVSALITPLCLASPHDLSVLPVIQELSIQFRFLGPAFWGPVKHLLTSVTRSWARPIIQLRAEIGLPKARDNPLVERVFAEARAGHFFEVAGRSTSQLAAANDPDRLSVLRSRRLDRLADGAGPVSRRRPAAGCVYARRHRGDGRRGVF